MASPASSLRNAAAAAADLAALARAYIVGPADATATGADAVISRDRIRFVPKGATLLAPGDCSEGAALVLRGCLRLSFPEADGEERVLSFAPEGWWIADLESLLLDRPSALRIVALEPSDVLIVDKATLRGLRTRGPLWNRIVSSAVEQTLVALQRRLLGSMRKSAACRYQEFQRLYPGLDRRIPQYQIAAYLGISPEFLCKLRKRAARGA